MANDNETVKQIAQEMQNDWAKFCFYEGTKKKNGEYSDVAVIEPEKVADRILSAHEREMAAKNRQLEAASADAEAANAEIARLRSLVGELADALLVMNDWGCLVCVSRHNSDCENGNFCDRKIGNNALVAMARDAVK